MEVLQRHIFDALFQAIAGDNDSLAKTLIEIADHGPQGVFVAVTGWSGASLMCLTGDTTPEGFYELEVTDAKTGERTSASDIRSRADREAIQMVSLYGNRDGATAIAIAKAAWDDDCGTSLMLSSVRLAATLAKAQAEAEGN